MSENLSQFQQLKEYIETLFCPEDEILRLIKIHSKNVGLPPIQIPAQVGKLLSLLAKIQGANRILEIGTLGGYSTIWLARPLPPKGKLISLEFNPKHVEIARLHIEEAGLAHCIDIYQGEASEKLEEFIENQTSPFDLIFIDANKENNASYLDQSIQLSRPGTLILIDNLIPKGEQVGKPCNDEAVSIYQFNQYFAHHPSLETILLPILSGQGRIDGLGLARVKDKNN
jgi:predicted O-methyltransferase YrrM